MEANVDKQLQRTAHRRSTSNTFYSMIFQQNVVSGRSQNVGTCIQG